MEQFGRLLHNSNYDADETEFLMNGFTTGFDIRYEGPMERCSEADNIPLTIGSDAELWSKIMKEVGAGRVAGPFPNIPFKNYIQSPVGLVPKAGGKTRMIFHLSYKFSDKELSLNACTPQEKCTVKYNDLDVAVNQCLNLLKQVNASQENEQQGEPVVYFGKTNLSAAFCVLPLKITCICWLVFKAKEPRDGKIKYFVEKCLPFGASISCSHYQRFSNALCHILEFRVGRQS